MNNITLIGNLGRAPRLSYTPDGRAMAHFSVAENHRWTDRDGERQESTQWFACSAWGRTAEVCAQYLEKGSYVYVQGRLEARSYQTRDGRDGFSLDVAVQQVQFLDGGSNSSRTQAESRHVDLADEPDDVPDDEFVNQ